jgi:hypothetical protein
MMIISKTYLSQTFVFRNKSIGKVNLENWRRGPCHLNISPLMLGGKNPISF